MTILLRTATGRLRGAFLLCAVVSVLLFTSTVGCRRASADEFEDLMKEAKSYDPNGGSRENRNRDKAVETYRRAIESRGDHPKNVDIEFHIGELLAYIVDPKNNQDTRPDDALEVFDGIIEKYPKSNMFTVRSAILAGDLHMIKGETEAGRTRYRLAIAGLAETYTNRKLDNPQGDKNLFNVAERQRLNHLRGVEGPLPEANDFDLFNRGDRRLFAAAARQYLNTFGPRGTIKRLEVYKSLAREYPDTPFERIALKNEKVLLEKLGIQANDRMRVTADAMATIAPDSSDMIDAEQGEPAEEAPQGEPEGQVSVPAQIAPATSDGRSGGAIAVVGVAIGAIVALGAAALIVARRKRGRRMRDDT